MLVSKINNNISSYNLYNNKQNKNIYFSGRIYPEDEIITIIPNFQNKLEKALKNVGLFDKNRKPLSYCEKILETGNRLKTFFQKDGKTPSYTIEVNKNNKKVRSVFFDIDGKTKLEESIYDELGNIKKSLCYKKDGETVLIEKLYK